MTMTAVVSTPMTNGAAPPVVTEAPAAEPQVNATPSFEVTDPTAAAAPVAEEAKTEAPAVVEDRLARAKAAAAKAKQSAARNRKLQEERQRYEQQARDAANETARLRQERARDAELQERLRKDPLSALRDLGVKDEDLIKRAIQDGTPEAKIAQLEALITAERQDRQQLEQRISQDRMTQAMHAAQRAFTKAAANEAEYPHLAAQPPSILLAAAQSVLQRLTPQQQASVTNNQLLEYLEWTYAGHTKAKAKTPETTQALHETPSLPPAGHETRAKPAPPRTLTNALSSAVYTMPKDFDTLSDAEQKTHLAEMVRAMAAAKGR